MEIKLNKKNSICDFFGHKWKYNFPSVPNKRICARCYIKEKFNIGTLKYNKVDVFSGETRTNKELIKKWVKIK
jgi:hypothetical protein